MKSTISDNRQMFNAKTLASGVKLEALAEGQLGIFPLGSDTSIVDTTTFADLPQEFTIVSKVNGKLYYSFDTINKNGIKRKTKAPYKAPVVNKIKTTIDNCRCTENITLVIRLSEVGLEMRDGLTWAHQDFVHVATQDAFSCHCLDGEVNEIQENNVFTMLLVKSIVEGESPYYTASMVKTGTTDVVTLEGFAAFLETNLAAGEDAVKLDLILEGKEVGKSEYDALDINFQYARGVKLDAGVAVLSKQLTPFTFPELPKHVPFTVVQELGYEIGGGADLREEEFDIMSYSTNMIHAQLPGGFADPNLKFRFENGAKYSVVNFDFETDKSETNNGDKRLFGVLIGTTTAAVYNKLVTIFGV